MDDLADKGRFEIRRTRWGAYAVRDLATGRLVWHAATPEEAMRAVRRGRLWREVMRALRSRSLRRSRYDLPTSSP